MIHRIKNLPTATHLWFFELIMIIFFNHNKQVVHRLQTMNLRFQRKTWWRESSIAFEHTVEIFCRITSISLGRHLLGVIVFTLSCTDFFFNGTELRRVLTLADYSSHLEKLVCCYRKVNATTVFAYSCINPDLFFDLLRSRVFEPCRHSGSYGDSDDLHVSAGWRSSCCCSFFLRWHPVGVSLHNEKNDRWVDSIQLFYDLKLEKNIQT